MEYAVRAMLRMNVMTYELQETVELVGELGDPWPLYRLNPETP